MNMRWMFSIPISSHSVVDCWFPPPPPQELLQFFTMKQSQNRFDTDRLLLLTESLLDPIMH